MDNQNNLIDPTYYNTLSSYFSQSNQQLSQFYKNQELYARSSTILDLTRFCQFCQSPDIIFTTRIIPNQKNSQRSEFQIILCKYCHRTKKLKLRQLQESQQDEQKLCIQQQIDPRKQKMLELLRKGKK